MELNPGLPRDRRGYSPLYQLGMAVLLKLLSVMDSVGHGGRRCETERKTEIEIHGYHQERYQEEWTDGRQHSRPQGLEIGSFQGDPLTWKSLQGEKGEKLSVMEKID